MNFIDTELKNPLSTGAYIYEFIGIISNATVSPGECLDALMRLIFYRNKCKIILLEKKSDCQ